MSTGGLSVRALAADGMPSTALQWIEMQAAPSEEGANAGKGANSSVTVNTRTNDFVRLVKDPLNLISVLGPARSGKSEQIGSITLMRTLIAGRHSHELVGRKQIRAVRHILRFNDVHQGRLHPNQDHDSARVLSSGRRSCNRCLKVKCEGVICRYRRSRSGCMYHYYYCLAM